MIITTGRTIKAHLLSGGLPYTLERTSATPDVVWVLDQSGRLALPGNKDEAERFIAAYRRVLEEEIDYKKEEVE
jgi:hypothetical protein